MADLTLEYMQEVSKGFSALFNQTLTEQSKEHEEIALIINSSSAVTDYTWLSDAPNMREWIGERVVNSLKIFKYTIANKKWESTIGVDRRTFEEDNLGLIAPRVKMLAESASTHYKSLVWDLLEKNGLCYDGKEFFSSSHPVGGSTLSNDFNLALNAENFLKVRAQMKALVNDNGTPLGINPSVLIVSPALESAALKILNATQAENGQSNITYNMCKLIVCPYLVDDGAWYLADTTRTIKPIILQKENEPEFVSLTDPKNEIVFMQDKFLFGVRCVDNAGYGLWQMIARSKA